MSNKYIFSIFVTTLIIVSGILTYLCYTTIDDYKIVKSNNLYEKARLETNPQERGLYLIESNLLVPTESKLVQITEAALEANNLALADEYIGKIDNQQIRDELMIFKSFSEGDYGKIDNLKSESLTNLGALLHQITKGDYQETDSTSAFLTSIGGILDNRSSSLYRDVGIIKLFTDNNQPYLSLYILDSLSGEHKCLISLYEYRAQNYEVLNKYEDSLKSIENALKCDTANIELYKKAINYAQVTGNAAKENLYRDKLEYLDSISN